MPSDVYNRLSFLKSQIERHNKLYHGHDDPVISDKEFDNICVEYDNLVVKNPNLGFTKREDIGFEPLEKFAKIKHSKPMLSLNNGFNMNDIDDFIKRTRKFLNISCDNIEFVCEPKIDGLSISLLYENGELRQALTRGNGYEGELVTENILTINNIPKKIIDYPEFLEVRGEIFISKDDFEKLNEEQLTSDKKVFSNPRNAAAGSIRQKDSNEIKKRNLMFFAYTVGKISDENLFDTQINLLNKFKYWGFDIPENIKLLKTLDEISSYYNTMLEMRDKIDYEIDGLVYKVNSFALQKRLGEMSRAPRWAIAHKLPSLIKESIIEKIDLQVGRTGTITPVARVKKVKIGGVEVSNVTLHNEDEIERKDIRIGDTVLIERAGDVIPHILSVNTEKRTKMSEKYFIPKYCPACGQITLKKEDEAARKCINTGCKAQKIENLIHFCSKNGMNIDGLGNKQIKLFFRKGIVTKYSDIFKLYEKKDELKSYDGFGELSVNKLLSNINKAKLVNFDKFLTSLGIKQVGENTAKILAEHYIELPNLINNIKKATDKVSDEFQYLVNIDQIGMSVAEDLINFFNSSANLDELDKLSQQLSIKPYQKLNVDNYFLNKKVVITGTLNNFTRDEIKTKLNSLGSKFVSQVSKNIDLVIYGENPGSKLSKAQELNIKIIDEKKLNEILDNL
ncbi:MAG: NAD-dependent DNA ligase LigA [Alphaproteobacteria bacterium]|nr:MAG: NAD-dependent DNA ligase LigA [Alphaproteobacteria bacterium]